MADEEDDFSDEDDTEEELRERRRQMQDAQRVEDLRKKLAKKQPAESLRRSDRSAWSRLTEFREKRHQEREPGRIIPVEETAKTSMRGDPDAQKWNVVGHSGVLPDVGMHRPQLTLYAATQEGRIFFGIPFTVDSNLLFERTTTVAPRTMHTIIARDQFEDDGIWFEFEEWHSPKGSVNTKTIRLAVGNDDIELVAIYRPKKPTKPHSDDFVEDVFPQDAPQSYTMPPQFPQPGLKLLIDSSPARQVVVIINGQRLTTPATVAVEPNSAVEVAINPEVPARNGAMLSFQKWSDGYTDTVRSVLISDKSLSLVAQYAESARPNKRPPQFSHGRGLLGRGVAMTGLGDRIDTNVTTRSFRTNAKLTSAINRGKKVLDKYANAEYRRVFGTAGPIEGVIQKEINNRENALKLAKKEVARTKKSMTAANTASATAQYNQAEEDVRTAMHNLQEAEGNAQAKIEQRAGDFGNFLAQKSKSISLSLSRKIRLTQDDQSVLTAELSAYAAQISEEYITGATNKALRVMRRRSRNLETFGSMGQNFLPNLWSMIMGPWTLLTVAVVVEFFMLAGLIGMSPAIIAAPLVAGFFTLILNISKFSIWDLAAHFMAGAAIGLAAIMLLYAIRIETWGFGEAGSLAWWIAWLVITFVGVFKIYREGSE